ncbi:type VI secretion system-associated FHA domain protein TagH [Aquabacterium sp. A7-Y]|uniref:type VI secretion system-associated FHA domain protein TagH n=1 Tax=Aquabacterium sp. A7-Y TaxID=1349605 RepID=UPI00223D73F4|nr:type VI secretion system-associated FHA domain protein TagH [Aquabacterium sp. A7-Y]MCW7540761.1 type VI secretion system-associated FHA domain protein TagH [Aquabacterium sp. A7-Y]
MLQIRVVSVAGQRPASAMAAQFGPTGGTIGRNEGNTLVLPDEAKTISRQQALVQMQGGQYVLIDKGANPTLRNRVPVGAGQAVPLSGGDELRIGPYVLMVEAPASRPFDANSTQVKDPGATASAPMQGHGGGVPATGFDPFALPPSAPVPAAGRVGAPAPAPGDPFADLFGSPGAPVSPQAPSAPRLPAGPITGLGAPAAAPGGIPDDFDPFASLPKPMTAPGTGGFNPLSSGSRRVPAPIPFDARAGHEDLLGPAVEKSASIDELFGLGNAPANPLDVLGAPAGVNPSSQPVDDPLALFGGAPAGGGAGPAQADQTPAVHSAFALPQVSPPAHSGPTPMPPLPPAGGAHGRPVTAKAIDDLLASVGPLDPKGATGQFRVAQPTQSAPLPTPAAAPVPAPVPGAAPAAGPVSGAAAPGTPAASASQVSVDTLMAAFCEGLGSPLNLPDGVTEEFMYRMGGLVREAVQGTVDLLSARAVTKREVKASATMIMERNNNPLKFSPDAKTAMLYLVSGRLNPAFMPPITAMRDAYYDLRSHQFGFMAGTKAALEGVLERFEPQRLEGRLSTRGLVESIIPAARKARLWDLFTELYKEIAQEAEDDFHALFGQAFLKAYEEHVEALKRDMPPQE